MRVTGLIIVSIALITCDYRFTFLTTFKHGLSTATLPVQYLAVQPFNFIHWLQIQLKTQQQLITENETLRKQQLLLQAKIHSLTKLEKENLELKRLLWTSDTANSDRILTAQLLALNFGPFAQEALLAKGETDGVYIGQPVVDGYGVLGQVKNVLANNSKVLLLTDSQSAVPVQNQRNGIRSIAVGQGYISNLKLLYVTDTTDIQPGDLFVTSGLGLKFPVGYPVGTVVMVRHIPGDTFAQIEIAPCAHVNQSRQVLLIWPKKNPAHSSKG